jgi:hypothetical protein
LRNVDAGSPAYLRSSLRSDTVEAAASDAVYGGRGTELQPARKNITVKMANGTTGSLRKKHMTVTWRCSTTQLCDGRLAA